MPDAKTVVFSRDGAIMVSTATGDQWSKPQLAPFSGVWMDTQPTFAPDGSYLIFASNRPVAEGDTNHPTGNLWRVGLQGTSWGTPVHLPPAINRTSSIWGPSIARDGSLYFMDRVDGKGPFKLWRSQSKDSVYQPATQLPFGDAASQEVDPAVAPDESFIVFSAKNPASQDHERLHMAWRVGQGWGKPIDLGDAVNGPSDNESNEARIGADGHSLYFSSDRQTPAKYPRTRAAAQQDLDRIASWDNGSQNIWVVSLIPWLRQKDPNDRG
jgi:Tol biopolymer transport system component